MIPENRPIEGGVKDVGNFSEGFCLQVNTIIPDFPFQSSVNQAEPKTGKHEIWVICTDNHQSKSSLINSLIKNKLKKQNDLGLHIKKNNLNDVDGSNKNNYLNMSNKFSNNIGNTLSIEDLGKKIDNSKPRDGRWIVIQDWTECNLKCGGGEQTLQLSCMPPDKGGKPCEGTAIRKRPCNTQPCKVFKNPSSDDSKNQKYKDPIIKVMPLSNRPSRYDKCHLKELDVFGISKPEGINLLLEIQREKRDFINSDNSTKIPVRIIMNNKSISLYRDENLSSIMFTLSLESASFIRIPHNNTCFMLQGKILTQQAIVCSIQQRNEFVEEWDYDFNLFKYQCKETRSSIKLSNDSEMKKKLSEKITLVKEELIEERSLQVKKETHKQEELVIRSKVDQTEAMTLLAMQKESKLEELLEKEEKLREMEEQKELENQLKIEETKKEVIKKSIREKELEDQFNISKENAEMAIVKIKEEAKKTILHRREEIRNKINKMRLKAERKKLQIKTRILSMRTETAQQIQNYSKNGNMMRCFNPNKNENRDSEKDPENNSLARRLDYIEIFCTGYFSNNISKFIECKNPNSFCFVCCETEFGQLHLKERDKCYNQRCAE